MASGLAKLQLQGRRGEQIGATVPANIFQAVELVGYLGNGCRNDGLVERHEEDGETQGSRDEGKLRFTRVLGDGAIALGCGLVWFLVSLLAGRPIAECWKGKLLVRRHFEDGRQGAGKL